MYNVTFPTSHPSNYIVPETDMHGHPQVSRCIVSSADIFFSKLTFEKYFQEYTFRVSNSLDLDQAPAFVEPDLRPKCLRRVTCCKKITLKFAASCCFYF